MYFKLSLGNRRQRGNLSELAMSLLVFFMFFVFPLINLTYYAAAAGTVAFITTQAAGAAANQADYATSLAAMQTVTQNLTNSGWGKFARLTPSGGFIGCGADLYVVESPISPTSGATNFYGPNTPDPNAADPTKYIYEYRVRTNFSIAPFLNLAWVPFIGNVPMIGVPAALSWSVDRGVECAYASAANNPPNQVVIPPNGNPPPGPGLAPPNGGGGVQAGAS